MYPIFGLLIIVLASFFAWGSRVGWRTTFTLVPSRIAIPLGLAVLFFAAPDTVIVQRTALVLAGVSVIAFLSLPWLIRRNAPGPPQDDPPAVPARIVGGRWLTSEILFTAFVLMGEAFRELEPIDAWVGGIISASFAVGADAWMSTRSTCFVGRSGLGVQGRFFRWEELRGLSLDDERLVLRFRPGGSLAAQTIQVDALHATDFLKLLPQALEVAP
jgi:hypothetical protein